MPFLKLHGLVFASLLVLHSSVVFAEKKHGIGIDIGVSNYTNRDDLASPLSYGGQEQTIGAFYDYRGAKNRHWVRVAYMTGRLKRLKPLRRQVPRTTITGSSNTVMRARFRGFQGSYDILVRRNLG